MFNKLKNFLGGRYGVDDLSRFCLIIWFAVAAINIFFKSNIIYALSLVPAFFFIIRVFSRNHAKRGAENARYKAITADIRSYFKLSWRKLREAGTHRYLRCPGCRAMLRFPRRTGKHTAVCPMCGKRFEVKIVI